MTIKTLNFLARNLADVKTKIFISDHNLKNNILSGLKTVLFMFYFKFLFFIFSLFYFCFYLLLNNIFIYINNIYIFTHSIIHANTYV